MRDVGRDLSQARKPLRLQGSIDVPIGDLSDVRLLANTRETAIELELILGNLRLQSAIAPPRRRGVAWRRVP